MGGEYKLWITQGQGCGEFPDAVFDTLEEALDEASCAFGEGGVGIQLPDGSWHKFGDEWDMRSNVTLLRMRKDGFNPKQKWLMGKWEEFGRPRKSLVKSLQSGSHTFQSVFQALDSMLKHREALELFLDSLLWGLFDVFEYQTGIMPSDEQIDWLVGRKKA